MWQILHKCVPLQEPQEYAVMQKWTSDAPKRPLTQFKCVNCLEEFFVLGHEAFFEAKSMREQVGSNLPAGFQIVRLPSPG